MIQVEIARKVTARLRVLFTESLPSNLMQKKTRNLTAYSEYLQGLHHMNHLSIESFSKAIAAFQRARHLEPSYTAAYAMEVWTTAGLVLWGIRSLNEGSKDIERLLGQAHNLDPNDPQYLGVKAAYHLMLDWNWPAAREALDQGLALHPNSAEILMHDSLYELVMGNYPAAIGKMEKVVTTNPLSLLMQVNIAIMYLCDRQVGKAEAIIDKALKIDPNFHTALENKGWILALKGYRNPAISIFDTMETFGYRYTKWSSLGSAYAMGGLMDQAQHCLKNLEDLITPENEVILYLDLALLHSWMGNTEEAFDYVRASFEKRKMEGFDVMHVPIWQKIWEHPGIGTLAEQYNLPEPIKRKF